MAENFTLTQSTARSGEGHACRIPFAPIYDTIVAEPVPEGPATSEPPLARTPTEKPVAPAPPRKENSITTGSVLFRPAPEPAEARTVANDSPATPASRAAMVEPARSPALPWILALGLLAILAGVVYLNVQLQRQRQILSDLAASSSQLAAAVSGTQRMDQRAWLTIAGFTSQPLAVAPGAFNLYLQNTGKTPATEVNVSATAQLDGVTPGVTAQAIAPVTRNVGALFPGGQFKGVLDFHLLPATLGVLYRGQGHLEIHINIAYHDVFHASHVTQSCWSWQPAFRELESCAGYGTVN